MKNRLRKALPHHTLLQSRAKNLYIVDYKSIKDGDVELLEKKPNDAKSVHLKNQQQISVLFDGFKDNSLIINKGIYSPQCECVLFSEDCNTNDWVLFIETKYTNNLQSAFKKEHNYPHCMINQIISTVKYFRDKGILEKDRRATAIVSFPNLIEEFNSTFFSKDISELDILFEHNILIRATNSAEIISQKRIRLI